MQLTVQVILICSDVAVVKTLAVILKAAGSTGEKQEI